MPYGIVLADQIQTSATNATLGAGNATNFKNRFINPQFQIAQRGTSGTSGSGVPTTTATYPSVDRWFAYGTGATVTVAQVAGSGNVKNYLQLTGAASVTGAGIGQRIEAINSYDLAGQTCTLSVSISNSLLTTVTWTAYYAGSSDVWTSSTQIATGTFTVTSSLTQYSTQISIPAAATTGIQIIFSVGAQTSGTFVISNPQLEVGSAATGFDFRDYGRELILCQRYYEVININTYSALGIYSPSGVFWCGGLPYQVTKRTTPTFISGTVSGAWSAPGSFLCSGNTTSFTVYGITANTYCLSNTRVAGNTTPTNGNVYAFEGSINASFNAEL